MHQQLNAQAQALLHCTTIIALATQGPAIYLSSQGHMSSRSIKQENTRQRTTKRVYKKKAKTNLEALANAGERTDILATRNPLHVCIEVRRCGTLLLTLLLSVEIRAAKNGSTKHNTCAHLQGSVQRLH